MSNAIYELNKTRIYVWMKYNSVEHRTYKWNRFNVVTTVTYKWNKFNCTSKKEYAWRRYSISETSGETNVGSVSASEGDIFYFASSVRESGGQYTLSSPHDMEIVHSRPVGYEAQHYDIGDYPYFMKGSSSGSYYYTVKTPEDIPIHYGHWNNYAWYDNWTSVYAKVKKGENAVEEIGTYPQMIQVGNTQTQGSLLGTVYSTSSSAYPSDGISGSYWYVRYSSGDRTTYSKGSAAGSVTSTNKSAYPSNGRHSDGYWYVSNGSTTSYSKGAANGSVTSEESDTYPSDGKSGNYWYTANGYDSTYSQGEKIGTVNDEVETTYPNNARHTDGFWYVKLI